MPFMGNVISIKQIMKKTDYSLLLGWEGPSVADMLEEFVDRYPESLNDMWDVLNGVWCDLYDYEIDRICILNKCAAFGIPEGLSEFIVSVCYDNNDLEWLLTDEKSVPFRKNIELGVAKNIKAVADEWLDDPDRMYNRLYEQLN